VEAGGPSFRVAADDGSVVYFSSHEKLTDDATTGATDAGEDLYRYDVGSGELTDITVDSTDPDGAELQGVIGASADGSKVYFAARGALAAGATAGEENLYLWTDDGSAKGKITFIAAGPASANWQPEFLSPVGSHIAGRVTPDGNHLLFVSTESLTGYPNEGHLEAYLYDATSGELRCASCNPAGTAATADASPVGAGDQVHLGRTLSEDGSRVFFNTSEQLAAGDTNAASDVYEFDAASGEINLISNGKGSQPSHFSDASADGRDVLFTTRQRLVGIDRDENVDVYDARIGGGFASQNPPAPLPPCEGEACKGTASPPPAATAPGSAELIGPGNAKRRHRHHGKHRRKHRKHKHSHHRNHSRPEAHR
jgi:Tol biopolymer transport system component